MFANHRFSASEITNAIAQISVPIFTALTPSTASGSSSGWVRDGSLLTS
jgi:hypothetical protein